MTTTIRTHDFRRNETLDRAHVRALQAAFDTFARHGSVELSTLLRRPAQLTVTTIGEQPWRDVTSALGDQPYLATFGLEPLHGQAVLSTSLPVAMRLIDFRLGGGSGPHFAAHVTPTDTDLAVMAGFVTPLLHQVASSLSRLREVEAVLVSQDSSIQLVQMAGPTDMFVVVELELVVADDAPVLLLAAFPFPLVRQVTDGLKAGSAPGATEEPARVDRALVLQTPIPVRVEIPPVELTPLEVAELNVGDVIRLAHPLNQPLDVLADGVLVARATRGHIGSKIVCSILEEISSDDR